MRPRALLPALLALAAAACSTPPVPVVVDEPAAADERATAIEAGRALGFTPEEIERVLTLSPLPDPPPDPTNRWYEDERAAHLGRFLFYDPRLSGDGSVSCGTCHRPERSWGDGRRVGVGLDALERNTMSLWNVAYNRWFFWDGRADSLWAQALQPLEDPREHGTTRLAVAHLVHDDPDLRRAYEELFGPLPPLDDAARFPAEGRPVPGEPDHPHARAWAAMDPDDRDAVDRVFANVGKAIAAFERELVSVDAPFDRFVQGLRANDPYLLMEIDESARRGLALFVGEARCHLCHSGPNFTDLEFHDTRVPPHGGGKRLDAGRYGGVAAVVADPFNGVGPHSDAPAGAAEDKVGFLVRSGHTWSEFKTPSLRNVMATAPYMHAGQLATIDDVIRYYDTLEDAVTDHHSSESILQPLGLTPEQRGDLAAFLETLTDLRVDPELRRAPPKPYPLDEPDAAPGDELAEAPEE